ncbi:MAG: SRPBCC family protein [Fimbriimonas sp.]
MSEFGVVLSPSEIKFERLLPGPIERVWNYLADSEMRGKWFASGEMELREGGAVELRFQHDNLSPTKEETPEKYKGMANGHISHGRITHCDPPRLLSFLWHEENGDDTEMTFELLPKGDEVLLTLTHTRLKSREEMRNVAGGWHSHLAILEDNLRGVTPRPFWSTHAVIEAEYEKRLG